MAVSSAWTQGPAVSSAWPQGLAVSSAWPQGPAVSSAWPQELAVSSAIEAIGPPCLTFYSHKTTVHVDTYNMYMYTQ